MNHIVQAGGTIRTNKEIIAQIVTSFLRKYNNPIAIKNIMEKNENSWDLYKQHQYINKKHEIFVEMVTGYIIDEDEEDPSMQKYGRSKELRANLG